jgi:uncharacterized protein YecA (UPF0149 family)
VPLVETEPLGSHQTPPSNNIQLQIVNQVEQLFHAAPTKITPRKKLAMKIKKKKSPAKKVKSPTKKGEEMKL